MAACRRRLQLFQPSSTGIRHRRCRNSAIELHLLPVPALVLDVVLLLAPVLVLGVVLLLAMVLVLFVLLAPVLVLVVLLAPVLVLVLDLQIREDPFRRSCFV